MIGVWIVVPAFNESENLKVLIPQIVASLSSVDANGRVLVVDDGSTDDTDRVLDYLMSNFLTVEKAVLARNRGKSAALQQGFWRALESGASVIVMMDADGQDDPTELPRLLEELNSGCDLVTGSRVNRHDRFIKRFTSKIYNRVTGVISGAPGQDFNSGFKVMTAAVASDVAPMLYGELHRYITVIAHWLGYRVIEVPVAHHERLHGSTKYGINRFWRGFMDLLTVKFLMSYEHRPSHLFGGLGILSLVIGTIALTYLFVERLLGATVGERPLLITGVLLFVVGLQLILFGLLAELVVYSRQQALRRGGP